MHASTHFSSADLVALAFNLCAFVGYRVVQRRRGRQDPTVTLQARQAAVRAAWVEQVVREGNGILGIQSLRNAMMASTFFASNTTILILGVLTLTAQGRLSETWTLLDVGEGQSPALAQAKLLLLLLTLLVGFFSFVNALRLFSHAGITLGAKSEPPDRGAQQVDAAWRYQGFGVRCYYFATPILFWLFGAMWFALAGIGAIALMHRFDTASVR